MSPKSVIEAVRTATHPLLTSYSLFGNILRNPNYIGLNEEERPLFNKLRRRVRYGNAA
jgi:hypothetical protein